MDGAPQSSLQSSGKPSVLVAVANRPLRHMIVDLLEQHPACWKVQAVADQPALAAAVAIGQPDLVVLDTGDFARFCRETAEVVDPRRVVVIGPEPDAAYERAALRAGAAAWLSRDRVGEDLTTCIRVALGCAHDPTRTVRLCDRYNPNDAP